MKPFENPNIEVLELEELDIDQLLEKQLVVLNDDHNTFEHVIEALVQVCGLSAEQAEQCTLIIHYKGKYAVKHGSQEELKPMRDAITERGIGAVIV
ncbi:MAG: ATP-dependent Clp protease adaptor ClpS [Bernardetiaceae bacterium]|jgi:ATP-dependent Clp protease adaptor protein ClpS|nr:ATP-dependent Clp protease adaptor ClpS [Bernardetiaceae bacterium]